MVEKLKIARFAINMRVLMPRSDASLQRRRMNSKGQAMVEFALVLFVALIVLFVAIQMAFIGQAALALGQLNYQAARYAAVNPTFSCGQIATYMSSNGSPTVVRKGVNQISGCGGAGGCSLPTSNSAGTGVRVCMVCTNATTNV